MSVRNTFGGQNRRIAAVVAVLAAVVGGLVYREVRGIDHSDHPDTHVKAQAIVPSLSAMFEYKPTLLVVGDSYADTYPDVVADKMGWSLALDSQDGTGFVHCIDVAPRHVQYIDPPPPRVRFIDRLDRDVATYRADYVLIDGGRSDLTEAPDAVVAAADEYITEVHADWPTAKIIIVLPAFATPDVEANYSDVAAGLRRTAESVGATVIDPVEQGWYRDVDVRSLRKDGTHLNDNGEIYYARRVIENLERMGSTA